MTDQDPWSYQLAIFIAGMLGYRFYAAIPCSAISPLAVKLVAASIIVALTVLAQPIRHSDGYIGLACVFLATALLPIIFRASRHSRIDRALGELSYPIYLTHVLIIVSVTPNYPRARTDAGSIGCNCCARRPFH